MCIYIYICYKQTIGRFILGLPRFRSSPEIWLVAVKIFHKSFITGNGFTRELPIANFSEGYPLGIYHSYEKLPFRDIYSEFSHFKAVTFHTYVNLPEGSHLFIGVHRLLDLFRASGWMTVPDKSQENKLRVGHGGPAHLFRTILLTQLLGLVYSVCI